MNAVQVGEENSYILVSWLFLRLLGLIYFAAFISLSVQITGLVGEGGIIPLTHQLQQITEAAGSHRFFRYPSIFWLSHSDFMLQFTCVAGAVLSLLLCLGVPGFAVCFLSITAAGREHLY